MNKRTLYFARPANIVGTEFEANYIKLLQIKWPGDSIVLTGVGAHLTASNVVILPFPDGKWGTDEWQIASEALDLSSGRYVWAIDPVSRDIRFVQELPKDQRLTSGQTLARLYFHDGSLRTAS